MTKDEEQQPSATQEPETPQEDSTEPAKETPQEQPTLDLPDTEVNLVPFLLEKGQTDPKIQAYVEKTMPEQVVKHFNEDWDGRSDWVKKREERLKLWLGDLAPKTGSFRDCANMHNPILLTRTLRLVTRVFSQIFQQGQPVFSAQASSRLGEDRADIITKHQNWELRKQIADFPVQVHRALIDFFLHGDCVFYSYRDQDNNCNRHEALSTEEFVFPYTRKTSAADMSDVPRKTRVLFPYKRDLIRRQKDGFYAQVDQVIKSDGTFESEVEEVIKDAVDKFEGVDRTESTSDAPYCLLEYHGWATLPYQEDEMPIRAVVDVKTRTLLALYSRYYDDPVDKARLQQQTAEYQQYLQAIQQYVQAMQLEQQLLGTLQQPHVPQDEAHAVAAQVQQQRPAPPVKPQWMKQDDQGNPLPPEPCKRKIIESFSHGTCIENPDGSYGLGVGLLLMPFQMAANIAQNQFTDNATLNNSAGLGGFIHENIQFPPGVTNIDPSTYTRIKGVPPDQVEKAIVKFNPPQANTQLLQAIQVAEAGADGVSSAPDVLSGQRDGDETFRGQQSRVEQSTQQLSVLASKFIMCLDQVAKNNALLDYFFLPDEQIQDVVDPVTQKSIPIKIGRSLYQDSFDVIFSADLSFASRQAKISERDDALGLLTKGVPPQIASLIFKPEIFAAAARECLKARGLFELSSYVMSDDEIAQKVAQQSAMPPGMPPGAGPQQPSGGPTMPPPKVQTGQKQVVPGVHHSPPPMNPNLPQ